MAAMFCPRCDRVYTNKDKEKLLAKLKEHVAEAHPDHDPDWWRDD